MMSAFRPFVIFLSFIVRTPQEFVRSGLDFWLFVVYYDIGFWGIALYLLALRCGAFLFCWGNCYGDLDFYFHFRGFFPSPDILTIFHVWHKRLLQIRPPPPNDLNALYSGRFAIRTSILSFFILFPD